MQHDSFGLRAAIKKLERGKAIEVLLFVMALPLGAWFFGREFAGFENFVLIVLASFFAAIWLEAREARIEALRASLRHVLVQKDPSILQSDEW